MDPRGYCSVVEMAEYGSDDYATRRFVLFVVLLSSSPVQSSSESGRCHGQLYIPCVVCCCFDASQSSLALQLACWHWDEGFGGNIP